MKIAIAGIGYVSLSNGILNVLPYKVNDDIYVIALKDVPAGGELLVDYRASMRVNFGLYLEGETLCQDG